jgi:nitroreductase
MKLDKVIQSRRSIRSYKSKSPSWKKIIEAIDTTRYAPMAGNIFTLNFILVDEEEKIREMAKWSSQEFIANAKMAVVFLSKDSRTINSYGKKDGEKFCRQQSGAAIQNFLLKLEESNISTCWVGLFNAEKVKKILKVPEDYQIEAIFPLGIANETPKKRTLRELDNFLYFNQFGNNRMLKIKKPEGRYPEGY